MKSSVFSAWQETVRMHQHLQVEPAAVSSDMGMVCINQVCINCSTGSLPGLGENPSDENEKPFMSPAHQIAISFKASAKLSYELLHYFPCLKSMC